MGENWRAAQFGLADDGILGILNARRFSTSVHFPPATFKDCPGDGNDDNDDGENSDSDHLCCQHLPF